MLTRDHPALFSTELLAPAAVASGVLVAASGGPDSMALLDLAARWRNEAAARPAVFAATVDHGLREGSRGEAQMVARFASARGVPHAILDWTGEKPLTRLQERARDARYGLLVAQARCVGANFILTAHHADDQAETILMRLLRGSAVPGLAGMTSLSERGGLTLFRPLLGVRKAGLVLHCESQGVPFVNDPSNENPRFGRTRARRLARLLETEGLGPQEWARLARRAARAEAALDFAVQASLTTHPDLPDGSLSMDMLRALPEEVALRRLAARACAAGGSETVRLSRVEAAWDRLARARSAGEALGLTLGGARIGLDRRGLLTFSPEPPRRRGQACAMALQSVHANGEKSAGQGSGVNCRTGASLGNGGQRA
ncbi:MAG: tRNA lysidine(34) synthetase TilS [Beijerinckiaceae bacterium]